MMERFRSLIAARLGLNFDEGKRDFLSDVWQRRLSATQLDAQPYLDRLEADVSCPEIACLARELTVCETYFFRHYQQLQAFAEVARGQGKLRIVSAGCSSGEEPYSLAMLLPQGTARIIGVDINSAMLHKASEGIYSNWALRETPEEFRRQWFRPQGSQERLHDTIRQAVRFEERNLIQEHPDLWIPDSLDVIYCRNLLMYLTPEAAQALVARFARALTPGGYLFLGHAENLRGLSEEFHLHQGHSTFYYQLRKSSEKVVLGMPVAEQSCPTPGVSDDWMESIRGASERISALSTATPTLPRAGDLAQVHELLRHERYSEALQQLESVPTNSAEVLLLRAVLRTHTAQLVEAEEDCQQLLQFDQFTAAAHYVLALCREGLGDRDTAVRHTETAAHLDPAFAMPRLHRGLLARRSRDFATARRELGRALTLLPREQASRLLLFSGGFSREALIAMCQAELKACGGSS